MYFVVFKNRNGFTHCDRFDSLNELYIAAMQYDVIVSIERV